MTDLNKFLHSNKRIFCLSQTNSNSKKMNFIKNKISPKDFIEPKSSNNNNQCILISTKSIINSNSMNNYKQFEIKNEDFVLNKNYSNKNLISNSVITIDDSKYYNYNN
jgi:hypothetical protein